MPANDSLRLTRTLEFTLVRADDAADEDGFRTVDAILSTEEPYKRWWDGYETLVHDEGSIDTERLDDGFPILWQHNRSELIGRLESYKVQDGQLRVRYRVGGSSRADDVVRQLDAGNAQKMSVGYSYDSKNTDVLQLTDDTFEVRVLRWLPEEASIVSCPADNDCSILSVREALGDRVPTPKELRDRAAGDGGQLEPLNSQVDGDVPAGDSPTPEGAKEMTDTNADNTADVLERERARAAALSRLARENDIDAETEQRWIAGGTEEGAAALEVVGILKARRVEAEKDSPQTGDGERTINIPNAPAVHTKQHKYSLQRALGRHTAGILDGLEKETSDRLTEESGRQITAGRIRVPQDEVARTAYFVGRDRMSPKQRAKLDPLFHGERYVTDASGSAGALNPDELLPNRFISLLRVGTVIDELGITTLPGLVGDVKIPRQAGQEVWSFTPTSGSGNLAETTNPTFDNITLDMKTAYSRQGIARDALMNSTPAAFSLVMNSMVEGAGETIMNTAINGTGANTPTGVLNATGLSFVNVAETNSGGGGASQMTYETVEDVVGKLRSENAVRFGMPGMVKWLFKGDDYTRLEFLQKFANTNGETVIKNGVINQDPAIWHNGLPDHRALYGKWSSLIIGFWNDSLEFRTADHENGGMVLSSYIDFDVELEHVVDLVQVKPA